MTQTEIDSIREDIRNGKPIDDERLRAALATLRAGRQGAAQAKTTKAKAKQGQLTLDDIFGSKS